MIYHIILIFLMIIWGLAVVLTKFIIYDNSPYFIAFLRFLIAFFIFFFYFLFKGNLILKLKTISKLHHLKIILLGLLGVTFYFILENLALLYASSNLVSLLTATIPAISAIIAYFVLKENLTINERLSILITFLGIFIVLNPYSIIQDFLSQFKGALLILVASIFWSFYSILGKDIFNKYDNLFITMLILFWGTIGLLPFTIIYTKTINFNYQFIFIILFLSIFASAAGYFLWNIVVSKLKVAIASNYLILMPIFTYIFSFYILKEKLTFLFFIGSLISFIGLFFMFNFKNFNYLKRLNKKYKKAV